MSNEIEVSFKQLSPGEKVSEGAKMLELHLRGMSDAQIAKKWGITSPTVSKWRDEAALVAFDPDELRRLLARHANRNERMVQAHISTAMAGGSEESRDAARLVAELQARTERLLGLSRSTVNLNVSGSLNIEDLSDGERASRLRDLLAKAGYETDSDDIDDAIVIEDT